MEKENAIVKGNGMNEVKILKSGLGDENVRRMTTVNFNDEKEKNKLVNTMTSKPDHYVKDCANKVINCKSFMLIDRDNITEDFNDETGEIVKNTTTKHVLILFDENNETYLTASKRFYSAFEIITMFNGAPSKDNVLKLKFVKVEADEKGHFYDSVELVLE